MCAKNLSNKEMTKIKVAYIHELNNFCIHHFYVEINLGLKFWFELVVFQNFQFEMFKFCQMTKIKVVDINELNNFGIHHFLC